MQIPYYLQDLKLKTSYLAVSVKLFSQTNEYVKLLPQS